MTLLRLCYTQHFYVQSALQGKQTERCQAVMQKPRRSRCPPSLQQITPSNYRTHESIIFVLPLCAGLFCTVLRVCASPLLCIQLTPLVRARLEPRRPKTTTLFFCVLRARKKLLTLFFVPHKYSCHIRPVCSPLFLCVVIYCLGTRHVGCITRSFKSHTVHISGRAAQQLTVTDQYGEADDMRNKVLPDR